MSQDEQIFAPLDAESPSSNPPIHWLSLNFYSLNREAAYRHALFVSSLRPIRIALIGGLALHTVFLYFDLLVLESDAFRMWRLHFAILMPPIAAVLALSFHPRFETFGQLPIALGVLANSLTMPVGIVLFGPVHTMYFIGGEVMILVYGIVLFGMRFQISAPVNILSVTVTLATVGVLHLPTPLTTTAMEVLFCTIGILTFGAYRMEIASRREHYIAEQLLAQERREREWLTLIAGFVRHELKNSVAGIGSSLQLISNSELDDRGVEYVSRATRSLQFMRRFLDQVAAATNLDGALRLQESQLLSLSDLVVDCVEEARQRDHGRAIRSDVSPHVNTFGNADSMVQLIDKLLNNAIEHSTADTVIEVELARLNDRAILTICNRGDALPIDTERLFKPFVTTKHSVAGENLGLGLYVAQTIASHHAGTIIATPLKDPDGACFTVSLPLADIESK